jgi:plasmid stability protein
MSKMIQIRHVPERLHQKLKSRAAAPGMSLSDYLRLELERVSTQLTPDDFRNRPSALEPTQVRESPTAAVRAERGAR